MWHAVLAGPGEITQQVSAVGSITDGRCIIVNHIIGVTTGTDVTIRMVGARTAICGRDRSQI